MHIRLTYFRKKYRPIGDTGNASADSDISVHPDRSFLFGGDDMRTSRLSPDYLVGVLVASGFIAGVLCMVLVSTVQGAEIDDNKLADAIYIAEGGAKAKKPYGVLSVPCNSEAECRRITMNTIRNNKRRFKEYGHKTHRSFLEFFASRWAPIGAENDPHNLNKNWLPNVRKILNKG